MEDFSVKAIVIGVSIFIIIFTLSAIILYYNAAKSAITSLASNEDVASAYDRIMNEENFEDTLTGVEVKSLINKYAGDTSVEINIVSISGRKVSSSKYKNINNLWVVITTSDAKKVYTKIISKEKLDLINPVWNNRVEKTYSGEKVILNLNLNV